VATTTLPRRPPGGRFDPRRIEATHLGAAVHEPAVRPPGRWISLGIFAIAVVVYAVVGYHVTVDQHVVVFDALDRLTRAYQVWYNDPPKLAAIGFSFPPLTTLVFLPLALIKPLATGLVALPLTTALFSGLTILFLDRTLARCEMPAFLRIPIVLGFALNPMTVFYSGNGMSEAVYLALLSITLYSAVSWYETTQPRFLFAAGFGVSLLLLTRYGFILWAALLMVLIGAALLRRNAQREEVEGSIVAFAAPAVYALVLWILFNTLIVGDPFGWLTTNTSQAVNVTGMASGGNLGFLHILSRLVQVTLAVFPLGIIAVPAALAIFVMRRDAMGLWLGALVILGLAIMGIHAATAHREGLLTLRDAMPMALTSVVAAAWFYRSANGLRLLAWGATLVVLMIGLFTAYGAMKAYPFQSQEQAFVRAIRTGHDQEGTNSIGGFKVGIRNEAQMARYINQAVKGRHQVLTDNAQTFGVILLSGRPRLFFDRIIRGDGIWQEVLAKPYGVVSYLLVNYAGSGDLIRAHYPSLTGNRRPGGLSVVFRDDRYLLVKVPAKNPTPAAGRATTRRTSPVVPPSAPGSSAPKVGAQ
jgi:hypothetical protein